MGTNEPVRTSPGARAMRPGCLHLITAPHSNGLDALLRTITLAIRGGVDLVQYRRKEGSTRELVEEATRIALLCRSNGVPLLVNDRLDIALACKADGVHLGQDDLPWSSVRTLGTGQLILGITAATPQRMTQAIAAGADYVGAGPAFASTTKDDTGPPLDTVRYAALAAACRTASGEPLPLIAVGGVRPGRAAPLIAAGCAGVAVSASILGADDPEGAARSLRLEIESARTEQRA